MSYIEFNNVVKRYGSGAAEIRALDGASFSVEKGELAVILGASGAGKTTALNILGGMDSATDGSVLIDGQDIARSSESQLVEYRRAAVGFVFQFYNLFPTLRRLKMLSLLHRSAPIPSMPPKRSAALGWKSASTTSPPNSLAANSSALPSPEHSRKTPSSSCATSPQELSITAPANRFFSCCKTPAALRTLLRWLSPTTPPWPLWPTALSA